MRACVYGCVLLTVPVDLLTCTFLCGCLPHCVVPKATHHHCPCRFMDGGAKLRSATCAVVMALRMLCDSESGSGSNPVASRL